MTKLENKFKESRIDKYNELRIASKVTNYAIEKHNCLVNKVTQHKGWPNSTYIFPNGQHLYIEFKTPVSMLTPLQKRTIENFNNSNCSVVVIDNIEDGKSIVDLYSLK